MKTDFSILNLFLYLASSFSRKMANFIFRDNFITSILSYSILTVFYLNYVSKARDMNSLKYTV